MASGSTAMLRRALESPFATLEEFTLALENFGVVPGVPVLKQDV
jgi:hypothetical protein